MLKFCLCLVLAGTCLLATAELSSAQVRPYIGVSGSVNLATALTAGYGAEGGILIHPFYAGIEYGTYADYLVANNILWTGPHDHAVSDEQFWGVHAGYVLDGNFYLGLVVLRSQQLWNTWDSINRSWIPFTKSYLNVGPELRYFGLAHGHLYLAFAATIRRGFKAGLGYMF